MNAKFFYAAAVGITLLSAAATASADTRRLDLLGDGAQAQAAERTIVITPNMNYVNVRGGEVIKFVVGDKSFTWHFNGPATVDAFDLGRISPQGLLNRAVTAYVVPDTRYILN